MSDARNALNGIIKRLQQKRSLTPEDRTVLSLFRLYESTLLQKIKTREAERESVRRAVEAATGRSISSVDWRSGSTRKWPSLSPASEVPSVAVRLAESELAAANADAKLASAESWPEIGIGPTFKNSSETPESSVGAKITVSLPIWGANQGARAVARTKVLRSSAELSAAKLFRPSSLASLQTTFTNARSALEGAPKPGSLNNLITESERQFARGLVQPNALVEIYRSALESLEVTDDTEMQAVRSYFQHEIAIGNVPKEFF